jgi:hypothetical protein
VPVSRFAGKSLLSFAKKALGAGGAVPVAETVAGIPKAGAGFGSFLGAGGIILGQEIADPLADIFTPVSGDPLQNQAELEAKMVAARQAEEGRTEGLERAIAENLARIAAVAPDVYTKVLAGRRLPKGARVHGGAPREDLLELLGRSMAANSSQSQSPAADELDFLQGL